MRKVKFNIGAISDVGNFRKVNQDNILIKIGEDDGGEFGLFAIADGMGGLKDGDVASRMVVDNLRMWWHNVLPPLLQLDKNNMICNIERTLDEVIQNSNMEIVQHALTINAKAGTTLSLLFIYNNDYSIKHIGDSRIYALEHGIQQLTEDHSWVAEQVRSGFLDKKLAKNHPKNHILTRCLGVNEIIELYKLRGLVNNNSFMLCSDGLYKLLSEKDVTEVLKSKKYSVQDKVRILTELVKSRGEKDNISAILVEVIDENSKGIINLVKNLFDF
jgi:serine/threonine protein phosphatase PrpC